MAGEPSPASAGLQQVPVCGGGGLAPSPSQRCALGLGCGRCPPQSADSAFERPHSAAFSPSTLRAREAPEVSPQSPWGLNLWAPLARMLRNGRKGISFSHRLLEIVKVHFILTQEYGGAWLLKTLVQGFLSKVIQEVCKEGLPCWASGEDSACHCRGHGFDPWSGKIP